MRILVPLLLAFTLGTAAAAPPASSPVVGALFADFGPGSPGCALAVARDGAIVHQGGWGMADLEHGVPISPATVFDTGSMAKMFTAAGVLLLEEQGRLSLDDPIRKYVAELPEVYHPVTLRHLLHHTGGVRDYLILRELAGHPETEPATPAGVVALLSRQHSLDFPPGERFSYTNSGYVLLALAVEKASGEPLARFAEKALFQPLGMASTRFFDDSTRIVPHRADSYVPRPDGSFGVLRTWAGVVGDTGLLSTVGDLVRWDAALAHPGQDPLGRALARLATPGKLRDGTLLGYGAGLFLRSFRGLRTVGHGGATLGYVSDLVRFPSEELTVVCLCNVPTGAASRRTRQVAALFLGDRLKQEPVATAVPPEEASRLAGLYRDSAGDSFRQVSARDGKLVFLRFGAERDLAPLGSGRYVIPGTPGTVEVSFGNGWLSETGEGKPMRFERIEPVKPSPEALAGYAGTYRSGEVGADLSVVVQDGVLVLRFGDEEAPLEPFAPDAFRHEILGTATFARGLDGVVRGLTLSTPRAKGLWYERAHQCHARPATSTPRE